MRDFKVDALEVRESECIKIGVDTGAGKPARPESATDGKRIPGDGNLTFGTATREPVKSGKRLCVEGRDDWEVNLRVRDVQALVCKPLLSVVECKTMGGAAVMYGDTGYLFHQDSKVARKIETWIQKEITSSQYHGCTLAYTRKPRSHEAKRTRDWCDATVSVLGWLVAGSEPESPENPEKPGGADGANRGGAGGAHDDPMRWMAKSS